jgi:hypothetical protein
MNRSRDEPDGRADVPTRSPRAAAGRSDAPTDGRAVRGMAGRFGSVPDFLRSALRARLVAYMVERDR